MFVCVCVCVCVCVRERGGGGGGRGLVGSITMQRDNDVEEIKWSAAAFVICSLSTALKSFTQKAQYARHDIFTYLLHPCLLGSIERMQYTTYDQPRLNARAVLLVSMDGEDCIDDRSANLWRCPKVLLISTVPTGRRGG